ncbi:MAG: hypothetical protein K0R49_640 [Burkholderiales bacterium]|jgi:hypothetical protein|nr:hypothetical protein [Burkholderiales bacterium]
MLEQHRLNLETNLISKYGLSLNANGTYLSAIKQLYFNGKFSQYSASIDYVINLLYYLGS